MEAQHAGMAAARRLLLDSMANHSRNITVALCRLRLDGSTVLAGAKQRHCGLVNVDLDAAMPVFRKVIYGAGKMAPKLWVNLVPDRYTAKFRDITSGLPIMLAGRRVLQIASSGNRVGDRGAAESTACRWAASCARASLWLRAWNSVAADSVDKPVIAVPIGYGTLLYDMSDIVNRLITA